MQHLADLTNCTLCPRNCHADRLNGKVGYCKAPSDMVVARAALHMWEEPPISGTKGSGTVFFSGCAMGCVFCQNYEISKEIRGKKVTPSELADIFLKLQEKGAHNINLVTPSHYVPQIIESINTAKENNLKLPIVYNSSGYENVETLKMLDGFIDIYLPDFKYKSDDIARKYSNCEDYFKFASEAIKDMMRQVGVPIFDDDGIMKKGVIVRHLTLPTCLEDSKEVIKFLYETFGNSIFISIMNQYTPVNKNIKFPELSQKVSEEDYNELLDYAVSIGVENGFIQEGGTVSESFIPKFGEEGLIEES